MYDNRLDFLEERIDHITAVNTYMREHATTLNRKLSENRVEFITLRNQVHRTHELPPAVTFPYRSPPSRVYRPSPGGLPHPDFRPGTPVIGSALPVALPITRAVVLPPSLLPPPVPLLPTPPAPVSVPEEDNTCSEDTSAVSD